MADPKYITKNAAEFSSDDALQMHPTAKSAWDACNAAGFVSLVWERVEQFPSKLEGYDGVAESYSQAIKSVIKDFPNALQNQPNSVIAEFLDRSASENFNDPELTAELFDKYNWKKNAGYTGWNTNALIDIGEKLLTDEKIQAAALNWEDMDGSQRLEIAQRIQQIQATTYGYTPRQVTTTDLSGALSRSWLPESITGMMPSSWTEGMEAMYDPINDKITLDNSYGILGFGDSAFTGNDFKEFVSTVLHEGEHAFHDHLSNQLSLIRAVEDKWLDDQKITTTPLNAEQYAGYQQHMNDWIDSSFLVDKYYAENLLIGGGFREIAMVTHAGLALKPEQSLNADALEKDAMYRSNPTERHAFAIENLVNGIYGDNPNFYLDGLVRDRDAYLAANASETASIDQSLARPNISCAVQAPAPAS